MPETTVVNPPVSQPPVQQVSVPPVAAVPASNMSWTTILTIMLFIALYFYAAALAIIFNLAVEKFIPGENSLFAFSKQSQMLLMTGSLAAIFVFFPIFTKLAAKLKKHAMQNPSIKQMPLRTVLSYLTLAVTFLLVAGHVSFVIYQFLSSSGNLNTVSHLGVTLLIPGSIFLYLLHEQLAANPKDVLFFIFMTVLGVTAIVYALSTIPSPIDQQKVKQDMHKIDTIKQLHLLISRYNLENRKLPPASFVQAQQLKDLHGYAITGSTSYKICATFEAESAMAKRENDLVDPHYDHPKGEQCFTQKIDKQYIPATAKLISIKKLGDCSWEVAIGLDNFTPLSPLTINSKGRVADKCNPNDFVDYSWTAPSRFTIEENGTAVIKINHGDFGKYTYTYTDSKGKKASESLEYSLTSFPLATPSSTMMR